MRHGVTKKEVAVVVVALTLVASGWVFISTKGREAAAMQARCLANLGQIGVALGGYLQESDDHWPFVTKLRTIPSGSPPWPELPTVLAKYGAPPQAFHCPADRRVLADGHALRERIGARTTWFETEGTSYEWLWGESCGGKKVGESFLGSPSGLGMGRADQPMLNDFEAFHAVDGTAGVNTLYADLKARAPRRSPARP